MSYWSQWIEREHRAVKRGVASGKLSKALCPWCRGMGKLRTVKNLTFKPPYPIYVGWCEACWGQGWMVIERR